MPKEGGIRSYIANGTLAGRDQWRGVTAATVWLSVDVRVPVLAPKTSPNERASPVSSSQNMADVFNGGEDGPESSSIL
ncbi:hypothetical protein ON010_g13259 [Phytophthora cinnamomi]|nr:hypothetical protein ON010_g13259 [Phytophthora cinnamomi]